MLHDLLSVTGDLEALAMQHGFRARATRADTQLRLQHTVEGLSVVAISYYVLGLLGYVVAPVVDATGIEEAWFMGLLAPLVLLVAWLGTRWVRSRIHQDE